MPSGLIGWPSSGLDDAEMPASRLRRSRTFPRSRDRRCGARPAPFRGTVRRGFTRRAMPRSRRRQLVDRGGERGRGRQCPKRGERERPLQRTSVHGASPRKFARRHGRHEPRGRRSAEGLAVPVVGPVIGSRPDGRERRVEADGNADGSRSVHPRGGAAAHPGCRPSAGRHGVQAIGAVPIGTRRSSAGPAPDHARRRLRSRASALHAPHSTAMGRPPAFTWHGVHMNVASHSRTTRAPALRKTRIARPLPADGTALRC